MLELLKSMLSFDPRDRGTAEQLIQSRCFFCIRNKIYEEEALSQIQPGLDKTNDFCYKENKFQVLETEDLLKIIRNEINKFTKP